MRGFTSKVKNHKEVFKAINDELRKKVFTLLEGNGEVQDVENIDVFIPPDLHEGQKHTRHLLNIVWGEVCDCAFWVQVYKPHEGLLNFEAFVILKNGVSARSVFEPNEYFQDFLDPTELELEQFELETGYPYILSPKFFSDASRSESFEITLRTIT